MTEQINLNTVDAYLASVELPQGNLLPAPLVIISDDNPLYDEPGVLKEMEEALAEARPAKIDGEITQIETYSSALVTVTFTGVTLENSYRVNVPRQLMQVGYMYNRLLHSAACAIITESEAKMQLNKDFNSEDVKGVFLPAYTSEDIMLRLVFPKEMSEETRLAYNYTLNNVRTDYTEGLSKKELKEIAPKVRLVVNAIESRIIRGDVIEMLLGLVEGNEDALIKLYDYAPHVDSAKAALDKNALLSEDERKVVIIFEYIAHLAAFLNPENLIRNIDEIEKATPSKDEPEEESQADLEDLFSDDFAASMNEIITGFRQENPDTVTVNEDSTYEERVEYLGMASNLIPLMGGLMKLSDRINVDLYYSTDWNQTDVTEENYGTRGEYLIMLTLLVVQRMHMFAKSIDINDDIQEMKSLALSLAIEGLTQDRDIDLWYLKDALYRAGSGNTDPLLQFLIMALVESPKEYQIHSPFGQMMHWLGHIMVEDNHTREEILTAFAKLPIMKEFAENVYHDAAETDEDDEDDEQDCFVTAACLELPFLDGEPNIQLAEEATAALVAFAELCLRKDTKEAKKGTPEWEESMGLYLNRILSDD